jgi:dihydroorotase-like cyclic amidohydrolase
MISHYYFTVRTPHKTSIVKNFLPAKKGLINGAEQVLAFVGCQFKFLVEQTAILHKHKLTPYEGENLFGTVNKTFLRGQKVFDNGSFVGRPHGKIVMGNHGT